MGALPSSSFTIITLLTSSISNVIKYRYVIKYLIIFIFCLSQASSRPQKSPAEHALSYFDSFHKPVFGAQWPSIRVALLSQQKYCALLNNFSEDAQDIAIDLLTEGADDFIKLASDVQVITQAGQSPPRSEQGLSEKNVSHLLGEVAKGKEWSPSDYSAQDEARSKMLGELATPGGQLVKGSPSMTDFMPVKRVISEKEELALEEVEQGFYQDENLDFKIVADDVIFPKHLSAFTHERGNVNLFPAPKRDTNAKLGKKI